MQFGTTTSQPIGTTASAHLAQPQVESSKSPRPQTSLMNGSAASSAARTASTAQFVQNPLVNLVRMMEEARIASFGVPGGTGKPGNAPAVDLFSSVPDGTQTLVVEHRIRYVRPLDYRNVPADVDVWVSAVKPASAPSGAFFRTTA